MVLSHLIQACNHELWYSFSLHIILSCKHAATWLDSVNTSPVHFPDRKDCQCCVWADLFFLGFVQFQEPVRVFTYHNLCITEGRYSSHLQLLETVLPPAAGVWEPADHFSSILLVLCSPKQLLQMQHWQTDSTVLETTCALSYYSGKKLLTPLMMEILRLFIPCQRTHAVI